MTTVISTLPKTWQTKRLDEIARIVAGSTPKTDVPSYWDGDIFWATPKDLSSLNGKTLTDTTRKITATGLKSCAAEVLPAGSVLFSSRAPIGLTAINEIPTATNQGFKSFIPKKDILDSAYLYNWLRANRTFLDSLGNGATFKEVSKAVVARIEIPFPPLAEQKRIAAILDKADAIRRKLQQTLRLSDDFLRSVFLDMFGDPVTNPKGWDASASLGSLADLVSGVTKGRKLDGKTVRDVPYLAVANVQDKHLKLENIKSIPATVDEIEKFRLLKHDLLLTEGGDPDKLGRGSLWHDEIPECIHQNHIFRVRLTDARVDPVFLNWIVGSERGKKYFLRSAKQTTGIASINMTQLRAFPMLIPQLPLQERFATIVDSVERKTMKLSRQLSDAESLFSSLQQRAFRGEL